MMIRTLFLGDSRLRGNDKKKELIIFFYIRKLFHTFAAIKYIKKELGTNLNFHDHVKD